MSKRIHACKIFNIKLETSLSVASNKKSLAIERTRYKYTQLQQLENNFPQILAKNNFIAVRDSITRRPTTIVPKFNFYLSDYHCHSHSLQVKFCRILSRISRRLTHGTQNKIDYQKKVRSLSNWRHSKCDIFFCRNKWNIESRAWLKVANYRNHIHVSNYTKQNFY